MSTSTQSAIDGAVRPSRPEVEAYQRKFDNSTAAMSHNDTNPTDEDAAQPRVTDPARVEEAWRIQRTSVEKRKKPAQSTEAAAEDGGGPILLAQSVARPCECSWPGCLQ